MRVRGLLVDSLAARATETRNMDTTTIERDIRDFLSQNFPLADEGSELAGGDSLIEAGVIDSTGVLELIEYLEANYEIQIADEEVLPDNLDSIERIGRFVSVEARMAMRLAQRHRRVARDRRRGGRRARSSTG